MVSNFYSDAHINDECCNAMSAAPPAVDMQHLAFVVYTARYDWFGYHFYLMLCCGLCVLYICWLFRACVIVSFVLITTIIINLTSSRAQLLGWWLAELCTTNGTNCVSGKKK